MANSYFQFKEFRIEQEACAMKVTTDSCIFGSWVAALLEEWQPESVLDIGTGTGLLSLMIAQRCKAAITALELDAAAATQAGENFRQSSWGSRLTVYHRSLQEFDLDARFECIVSNPPFHEGSLKGPKNEKNLAHHADELPLHFLLTCLKRMLNAEGRAYLLLPAYREAEFIAELETKYLYCSRIISLQPHSRLPATRIMAELLHTGKVEQTTRQTWVIREKENAYSMEIKKLLAPYYLYE